MVDNPRGHENGDVAIGSDADRSDALDFQFRAFLTSISEEGMHSADDLAAACDRMAWELRHGKI
jgi:hypothetical protein